MHKSRVKTDALVPEPMHMRFGGTHPGGNVNRYLNPELHSAAGQAAEIDGQTHPPFNREGKGKIKALYITASAPPGGPTAYTLNINGAPTALTVALNAGATGSAGATELAVAGDPSGLEVLDTDVLSILVDGAVGTAGHTTQAVVELEETG